MCTCFYTWVHVSGFLEKSKMQLHLWWWACNSSHQQFLWMENGNEKSPRNSICYASHMGLYIYTQMFPVSLLFTTCAAVGGDMSQCYSFTSLPYCATSLSQLMMMMYCCEGDCCENEQRTVSLTGLQTPQQNFVHPHTTVCWPLCPRSVCRPFRDEQRQQSHRNQKWWNIVFYEVFLNEHLFHQYRTCLRFLMSFRLTTIGAVACWHFHSDLFIQSLVMYSVLCVLLCSSHAAINFIFVSLLLPGALGHKKRNDTIQYDAIR